VTAHHVLHLTAPAYSCPELESLLPEDCPTLIPLPYAQLAQQEVASGTRPQASAYPSTDGFQLRGYLDASQLMKM